MTVRRLGSLWHGASAWFQLYQLTPTGIVLVERIPRPSQERWEASGKHCATRIRPIGDLCG